METTQLNSYDLSRKWFNYSFDNPEKVKPIHSAIYFFAIEHCNRLGWKTKFGFPSQMVMEAVGVKNWRTYSKALNELVEFGFIEMIETSKNQYSSNIIAIVKNTKAPTKALDKALQKHSTKQGQSTVSIDKQETKNKEQVLDTHEFETQDFKDALWLKFLEFISRNKLDKEKVKYTVTNAYEHYRDLEWHNTKGKPVKNLYTTIKNNWFDDLNKFRLAEQNNGGDITRW